jgi:TPR repeat protein
MKYSILLCLGTAIVMGCASVDETATQSTADTPNSDIQALKQMADASPVLAHRLYLEGHYAAAFDMNYDLAKRGDDRSQYNLGVSYHNGIEGKIKRDYVEAYAWMITSEMKIQESTRTNGLDALKSQLSEEKQRVAQQRAAVLFDQYGSGDRVQSNLDSISTIADTKAPPKSCSRLGSKLKRSCHGARQFRGRGDLDLSPITGAGA